MISALLCVIVSALSGCGAVEQTNGSLTVWVADPWLESAQFSHAMLRFKLAHRGMEVNFSKAPEPMEPNPGAADYESYRQNELKTYADQMRTEVMGRRGPDLIIFAADTFPNLEKTVASGAFAPLDGFIEGDGGWMRDADGQPEPISEALMEAGVFDGKRYFVPLSYNMPLVIAGKEQLAQYGISTEENLRHDAFIAGMARAADSGFTGWLAPSENAPIVDASSVVDYVLWDGVVDIDYRRQTLSIDKERLKTLADNYRAIRQYEDAHPADSAFIEKSIGEGNMFGMISRRTAHGIHVPPYVACYGEPYVSPLLNADGEIAVYLQMGAAINAYSPNQQNAYEFLKYAMEAEGYKVNNEYAMGLPANQKALKSWLEACREANARQAGGSPTKAMPDSYFDQVWEWQQSIGAVCIDTGLDGQMQKWFMPYYRGEQSFESCCTAMESALGIIVSE